MLKEGILVALLAYNEEENLKVLIPKIREAMQTVGTAYEIEIVDTETPTDGTPQLCRQWGIRYYNQEEPGFGGAFRTAIKYADYKMFLILDSDGSHDPQFIPSMVEKYIEDNCDLVIGSRYVKGGKTFDSKTSIAMSKILNGVYRLFLGIRAKDISTDYRLYDAAQLKQLHLENMNYDVLQEVLLKLRLNNSNFKIEEVPITFEKRIYGKSKRKLIPFIISYIKTLVKLTAMRVTHG